MLSTSLARIDKFNRKLDRGEGDLTAKYPIERLDDVMIMEELSLLRGRGNKYSTPATIQIGGVPVCGLCTAD